MVPDAVGAVVSPPCATPLGLFIGGIIGFVRRLRQRQTPPC